MSTPTAKFVFTESSANYGDINNAVFEGSAYNAGSVITATFSGAAANFNSVSSGSFFDQAINKGEINTGVFGESAANDGNILSSAQFNNNASNYYYNITCASIIFTDTSFNAGTASHAIFQASSYNIQSVLSAYFNDLSINTGYIILTGVFTNYSVNAGSANEASFTDTTYNAGYVNIGTFTGNASSISTVNIATFDLSAVNVGTVMLTGSFIGGASNTGLVEYGIFAASSVNTGVITNAIFADTSINSGIVSTSAVFIDTAINTGTVQGSAVFSQYTSNQGTVEGNAEFLDALLIDEEEDIIVFDDGEFASISDVALDTGTVSGRVLPLVSIYLLTAGLSSYVTIDNNQIPIGSYDLYIAGSYTIKQNIVYIPYGEEIYNTSTLRYLSDGIGSYITAALNRIIWLTNEGELYTSLVSTSLSGSFVYVDKNLTTLYTNQMFIYNSVPYYTDQFGMCSVLQYSTWQTDVDTYYADVNTTDINGATLHTDITLETPAVFRTFVYNFIYYTTDIGGVASAFSKVWQTYPFTVYTNLTSTTLVGASIYSDASLTNQLTSAIFEYENNAYVININNQAEQSVVQFSTSWSTTNGIVFTPASASGINSEIIYYDPLLLFKATNQIFIYNTVYYFTDSNGLAASFTFNAWSTSIGTLYTNAYVLDLDGATVYTNNIQTILASNRSFVYNSVNYTTNINGIASAH